MAKAAVMIDSASQIDKRVAVVIMGMHRSGTSALARVLNLLGCQTPQTLMVAHDFNPKGHWESESIRQFNDEILQAVGSGWSDWAPVNPGFAKSPTYRVYLARAVALLRDEFGVNTLVVFKDPRVCRLGAFWMEALEQVGLEPAVILPLRNPLEVAASLARRDGFDGSYVQLLWLRHVLDAESSTRGRRRIFTTFNDLLDSWESVIVRIATELDVSWPRFSQQVANEITESLDADLKHHAKSSRAVIANPGLSEWLRDTYNILEGWAHNGENARDYVKLDDIRADLDASAPAFAQLILSGEKSRAQVLALEAQIAHLRQAEQQVEALEQELGELRADPGLQMLLSEERHRSNILSSELEALRHRLADQESALRQKQEEAAQAWTEVATGRDAAVSASDQSAELQQRAEALSRSLASSEAWVFKLAGERQEADRRANRLKSEVERLTREMISLKGEASRLKEALATEKTARKNEQAETQRQKDIAANDQPIALIEAERDLVVAQPDAARATPPALAALEAKHATLQANYHAAQKTIAEAARQRDESTAELVIFSRKLQAYEEAAQALPGSGRSLRQLSGKVPGDGSEWETKVRDLQVETSSLRRMLAAAERRVEDSSAEVLVLTRKLQETETFTEFDSSRMDWLRSLFLAVTRLPWWWHFLPPGMRRARVRDRLQQRGLFDEAAYLERYPDVSQTGLDPLRHYVRHGMIEGRHR